MADLRPIALPDGSVVHSDPDILSGVPVFVGTRVPVQTLVEYRLDEFLDSFPSVRCEQIHSFLEQAARALVPRVA
jgi:uncharacterized protein (DUF433 family)